MKPYKSVVRVLSMYDDAHIYTASSEDASSYVRSKLAEPVDDGKAFIGKIRLLMSLTALKDHINPPKKHAPVPNRNAQSSTGDAGRGLTKLGRYKTIHLQRTLA